MTPRTLRELAELPVTRLRHVGPQREAALAELGITSVLDLITYYPLAREPIDRTRRADLSDLHEGEEAAVFARVTAVSTRRTQKGRSLVQVSASDATGRLRVSFFNQPWRAGQLVEGVQALFFAKVTEYRGERQMTNPVVDVLVGPSGEERDPNKVGRLIMVYPTSARAGLSSWELGGFIEESLKRAGPLHDPVDATRREEWGLLERTAAFWGLHLPQETTDVEPARRRLAFDEFFRLQLLIALRRRRLEASSLAIVHHFDPADLGGDDVSAASDSLLARFLRAHRFALTGAQRRVLGEIGADMVAALPMHRLLQGDVGSGKTVVATGALLIAIEGGHQGALMAPTEVLAEQHAAALRADLAGLRRRDDRALGGERDVVVELLTGRVKGRERQRVLEALARGDVDVVVGTHALLSDDVRFASLGVVVIDEQHRFGVEQRAQLRDKGRRHSAAGRDPDLLVMTATPIPRTAAMVVFGDLDLSVLDEMPAGRRPVRTLWARGPEELAEVWRRVREEVLAGRRAYVVCPLVETSERVEAQSAVAERLRLATNELAGLTVGLLHGQMKPTEKDEVMAQFRAGEIQVLVATVVIEVGVDVPDASVIVIEDAWRFGLAQLHQLRGRVGRGSAQSDCYLLGDAPGGEATARLEALVASHDGFALAEIDLGLRGEGTLLGARQRGRSDLRLGSLRTDQDLVELARDYARTVVGDAPLDHDLIDELRLFVEPEDAEYLFRS